MLTDGFGPPMQANIKIALEAAGKFRVPTMHLDASTVIGRRRSSSHPLAGFDSTDARFFALSSRQSTTCCNRYRWHLDAAFLQTRFVGTIDGSVRFADRANE